tara:strand:+ start:13673 stop:13963 length:291 start_codon:yes stop_codon:yes gene_type:complete
MNYDIQCPYCGKEQDVCHDDGAGYEEDKAHEMECCGCEKTFTFQTHISYDYYPSKADCMNGAPHDFGGWSFVFSLNDKNFEDRHCKDCEKTERRTV